ncbi:MAG TPA: SRPBCC family protein [Longimicrobiales bacterium]
MPRVFSTTIDVDAPAAVVFGVMIDIDRWPQWTPTVTRVEWLGTSTPPLAMGSRIRVVQPGVPPAEWTVSRLEAGRGFQIVSRSPGATVTADHWIEPSDDGRSSRVTLSVSFSGWLGRIIGRMMRGLNERYIAQEAAGLRRRSEEVARGRAPAASRPA